jgi:hypothetical protein
MMNYKPRSWRSIDVAAFFVNVAVVLTALGTLLLLITLPSSLSAHGLGLGLDATVSAPIEARVVRELRAESPLIAGATVHAKLHVPADERDTRVIVAAGSVLFAALLWVALLALRAIVNAACDGDAFDARNVGRLRRIAAVLIAVPVVGAACNRLIVAAFDSDVVTPHLTRPGVAPFVIAGIGALALAEVFREGAALRELEQSTI